MSQNLPSTLTAAQQKWVQFSDYKDKVLTILQNDELACQAIINPNEKDLTKLQESIKSYKAVLSDLKEKRLKYTNTIKIQLIDPAMLFEKRLEEFEPYKLALSNELELRKSMEIENQKAKQKAAQLAEFKTHCTNENARILNEYRLALNESIESYFKECLNLEDENPEMTELFNRMSMIPTPKAVKREFPLLSREEMIAIHTEIGPPDKNKLFEDCKETAMLTFSNYDAALKNKGAGIKHVEESFNNKREEAVAALAQEQAINTLVIKSEAVVMTTPEVKIKRSLQIELEETDAFVRTIMAKTLELWPYIKPYFRVKSLSKLSIEQMAQALSKHATETGETVDNFNYKEVEK